VGFEPETLAVPRQLIARRRRCDIPIRCKMPTQTIKAGCANLSSSRATKFMAMATCLERSSES